MRILIVDDEHIIRKGISTIISRAGEDWEICGEATDGVDAIEQMNRKLPDLVITDIKMPEMDGIELTKYISKKFNKVLVIIISGYAEFNFAQEAIRYGALDYILKPTKHEQLISVLKKANSTLIERNQINAEIGELYSEIEILRDEIKSFSSESVTVEKLTAQKPQYRRKVIKCAIEYIHKYYDRDLTLKQMSELVYINHSYFCDLFKQETGEGFSDYLCKVRINKAKELLLSRVELRSYEVAEKVGYKDPKYFSQVFKKIVGVTPKEFRDGKAGE